MDANTIKSAQDALAPLFAKLGQLGAKGFELAVRQNYVYAGWDLIACIVILLVVITVTVFFHYLARGNKVDAYKLKGKFVDKSQAFKRAESGALTGELVEGAAIVQVPRYKGIFTYRGGDLDENWIGWIVGILWIAAFIIIAIVGCSALPRIINPEYMALSDIMKLISGK